MAIPPASSQDSVRRWGAVAGLLALALMACRSERAALATLVSEIVLSETELSETELSQTELSQTELSQTERTTTEIDEANLVTQVQMVRPAAERIVFSRSGSGVAADAVPPADGPQPDRPQPDAIDEANVYCRRVEQQARETHAGLPRRLDRDTSATRVAAYGCDVVLEYAMHDLNVEEVAAEGVRALRTEVVNKLCADGGARGVMDRGGSFTNVYRDQRSALIDQFTITAEDCALPLPAEDVPVPSDL